MPWEDLSRGYPRGLLLMTVLEIDRKAVPLVRTLPGPRVTMLPVPTAFPPPRLGILSKRADRRQANTIVAQPRKHIETQKKSKARNS